MQINQVTKRVEILQTKYIDWVAAMLVVMQQQAPQAQTSAKTVEVPPAQFAGTVVDMPVITQITYDTSVSFSLC